MMEISRRNKKACLFIALLSISVMASAQTANFKYKAAIQKIDSNSVYRIELSPELIAKSNAGLTDIRLADNKGKNVAYALSKNLSINYPDKFIVFSQVAPSDVGDTIYVFDNKNNLDINRLWLKLKNTEVARTVDLSGGDDLKKWYAIKEDIPLEQANSSTKPDYQQSLSFPSSNYRYFRILVNGKSKMPVKILQAGIYTASLNAPVYTALPAITFSAKDSAKKTDVLIDMPEPYLINRLHLTIRGPKFYSRKIMVYTSEKSSGNFDNVVADTVLASSGSQNIILDAKTKNIKIVILNGDDNDLNITSIQAYQLKQYAVSYLETGHRYDLFTGYPNAKEADYDLSFLNNLVYNQLPGITHLAVFVNPAFVTAHPQIIPNHSVLLWCVIIGVLTLLCFFTLKMVREIK